MGRQRRRERERGGETHTILRATKGVRQIGTWLIYLRGSEVRGQFTSTHRERIGPDAFIIRPPVRSTCMQRDLEGRDYET